MSFAVWQDSYATGTALIDAQHKGLFRMVNELHDAMGQGRSKQVLDSLLDRLIRYTETHFRDEEAAMQRCRYPELAMHELEHAALARQAHELQQKFRAGTVTISIDVLRFLANWLVQHITKLDQSFAAYAARQKAAVEAPVSR